MPMYFGPEVDEKILEFKMTEDVTVKNKIFEEHISPAMLKLIENQIYMYGFYKIDDPQTLKDECLSTMYETLPKFDPTKGTKAFSYFNVCVRHWFIGRIREKTRRAERQSANIYGLDHDIIKDNPGLISGSYEDELTEKEFWVELFRDMDEWRPTLKKKHEIQVLDSIVFLLQNNHLVSIYNKKAVFLYIREMTGLTVKQVNHNMNRLKELYLAFRERFHNGEER